jgi:hypothetical protein
VSHPTRTRFQAWRDEGLCPVCQVSLKGHTDCPLCTILVGPGHYEPELVGGKCRYCRGEWPSAGAHAPILAPGDLDPSGPEMHTVRYGR